MGGSLYFEEEGKGSLIIVCFSNSMNTYCFILFFLFKIHADAFNL